jgi:hypothetical protein
MAGISDQCHRVGQKSKAALDDHENQVQRHRESHSGIDALGRYAMGMRVFMFVLVFMLVPAMLMLFHQMYLTPTPAAESRESGKTRGR